VPALVEGKAGERVDDGEVHQSLDRYNVGNSSAAGPMSWGPPTRLCGCIDP
jgi:hypothetical protein